jgi:hypothetical protein
MSHGNTKSKTIFMPRTKSLRDRIKNLAKSLPPKQVVSKLNSGGCQNISSIASTPRDAQQVINLKRNIAHGHKSRTGSNREVSDFESLFRLSLQGDFVKSVELNEGGHPRAFLASDQQIADIARYCTGKNGSLLQIDPTFKLGQFYLTCTAYRHPKFENKSNGMKCLMPGPFVLHATREISDYEYFGRHLSNTLKGKSITLCGSDGEKAIYTGLKRTESFRETDWLICMIHARENCMKKLKDLCLDEPTCKTILKDIYGMECNNGNKARTRILGMVDSKSGAEFDQKLLSIIPHWDKLERATTKTNPQFSLWFQKHKAEECKEHMLMPLRQKAGLGHNPKQFTTNDVECINLNMKRQFDWRQATWDQAANHIHHYVLDHYEELSRSVYSEGKYKVCSPYKELKLQPYQWADMSVNERRKHLEKANLKVVTTSTLCVSAEESGLISLGFCIGDLTQVWIAASCIINKDDSIVRSPGDDRKSVVFQDDLVHSVLRRIDNMYLCDDRCEKFKYFDKLFCPHTLSVAHHDNTILDLLSTINVQGARPSINKVISSKCSGAGQKSKKRKGLNNTLSRNITSTVTSAGESSKSASSGTPQTTSLTAYTGSVLAAQREDLPRLTVTQKEWQLSQPFTITFRQGLIMRCHGCNHYFSEKSKTPPHDLILKKKDFKEYPVDGVWRRAQSLTNTYYHLSMDCVRNVYPHVEIMNLVLYEEIKSNMVDGHIDVLHKFGIHKACTGYCNLQVHDP